MYRHSDSAAKRTYWSTLKPDAVADEDAKTLEEMFGIHKEENDKDQSAKTLKSPHSKPNPVVSKDLLKPAPSITISTPVTSSSPSQSAHRSSTATSGDHLTIASLPAGPLLEKKTSAIKPSDTLQLPGARPSFSHADESKQSPKQHPALMHFTSPPQSQSHSPSQSQFPSPSSASRGDSTPTPTSPAPAPVDPSRPTPLSLGEMLRSTPSHASRHESDELSSANHHSPISTSATPSHNTLMMRASSSVPRGSSSYQIDSSKSDGNMKMPKFAFLAKGSKPLLAAVLPPPSPAGTPKRGESLGAEQSRNGAPVGVGTPRNGNGTALKTTPRNLEIGSQHAHAEQSDIANERKPRGWNFIPPTLDKLVTSAASASASASATSRIVAPSAMYESSVISRSRGSSHSPSRNSGSVNGAQYETAEDDPSWYAAAPTGVINTSAGPTSSPSVLSPTHMFSPVVLGSGILEDIISTNDRVIEALRNECNGVVLIDESTMVEHLTRHREVYSQAMKHEDGEFDLQLMNRKYNSDLPGLDIAHIPHSPDVATVTEMLNSHRHGTACPYAPSQWFFDPSNLSNVVQFHLVFQTIDFGLDQVPATAAPIQSMAIVNPETHQPVTTTIFRPYTSHDLALTLSQVLRRNPKAFDADSLTKMDELRLGSWLQPELFMQAMKDHPEAFAQQQEQMSSIQLSGHQRKTTIVLPKIEWTFPLLRERARLLRELGFTLLRFFNGRATQLVDAADHNASRLVELLTQHLPGMRDATVYHGAFVFFYSRAQGFVRNLWIAFHGHGYGQFDDLKQVHGQTDATLQTIFHKLGFIKYSNELREWLDEDTDFALLPNEVEVEMRAATGFVLRRMVEILNNLDQPIIELQLGQLD